MMTTLAAPLISPMQEPMAANSLSAGHETGWHGLLQRFYGRSGLPLPRIERLKDTEVPEPYRRLLVHSADMTPTLEKFYGQHLALTVLSRDLDAAQYLREVTLDLEHDGWPVEYGAIRIFLDHFPPRSRQLILREQKPLGSILQSEQIAHVSWPQAFFRTQPDHYMNRRLGLRYHGWLYGRRNVLLDEHRRLLAEVIEILSPVEAEKGLRP